MVDTLAPKRIFTQRELDQKLTPVTEQVLRTRPRERLLDVVPRITTEPSLLDKQTDEAMQDSKKQTGQIMTEEQGQTAKSSEEAIKEKQTGMKVSTEAERGQGLVMRPMEYAAKGKITILPNSIVQGMMSMPMKKAEKGADDIMIGRPEMPKLERIVTPEVKARELAEGVSTTPVFAGNPVAEEFSLGRMGYRQFVEPVLDSLRTAVYDASPEVGMSVDKYTESSIPNYSPGAISFAVEQKYEKEIEPKLVKEMNNLPQNLDGTDISGSLRDAYRHSYTAGMMKYLNLLLLD